MSAIAGPVVVILLVMGVAIVGKRMDGQRGVKISYVENCVLLIEHNCCLASQHVKGELNVVADLLSFSGSDDRGKSHPLAFDNPPDNVLTQRFRSSLPNQVPANFEIVPLPNEIISWVSRMLQTTESYLTAAKKGVTKVPTASGDGGSDSANPLGIARIPSSLSYPSLNKSFLSGHFCNDTKQQAGLRKGNLREIVRNHWEVALSCKPQATWVRRFGCISGTAPCTSRGAPTCVPPFVPSARPLTMSTYQNDVKGP